MAILPEKFINGENVVEVLNELKHQKKEVPERIQVDNGTEFVSKAEKSPKSLLETVAEI